MSADPVIFETTVTPPVTFPSTVTPPVAFPTTVQLGVQGRRGQAGQTFDQSLNTTDNVAFRDIDLYGISIGSVAGYVSSWISTPPWPSQSLNTTDSPRFNDLEIDQLGGGSLAGVIQNLGNSIPTYVSQLNNDVGYITGSSPQISWPNFYGAVGWGGDSGNISSLQTNGSIQLGGFWGGISSLNPDGSASFASGALTIDSSGNLTATNFTPSAYLTNAAAFDAAGTAASAISALNLGTASTHAAEDFQPAGSYATLVGGTVPASQLPSYVDDVVEYANLAGFPSPGETGKIYTAKDTNKIYRWSGSAYIEISPSPGSTDSVPEGATNLYFTAARAVSALASTLSSYATQAWVAAQGYITSASLTWGNITGKPSTFSPSAHASTHASAGSDPITIASSQVTGLGTAATQNSTAFDAAGAASTAQSYAIQRANHTGTQPASTITGLASVATSGSYADLSSKPTIPAAQVNSDWNATTGVAQILNKPSIPSFDQSLNTTDSPQFFDVVATDVLASPTVLWGYGTGTPSQGNSDGSINFYDRPNFTGYPANPGNNTLLAVANDLWFFRSGSNKYKVMLSGYSSSADLANGGNVSLKNADNSFTAGQTISASANTSALTASYSVTGSNTTPLLNLSGTWNTTGVATGLKLNITNTTSGTGSRLFEIQTSSVPTLSLTPAKQLWLWNQRTDDSNYERGFMRWNANVLEIGAEAGGTGSSRNVRLTTGSATSTLVDGGLVDIQSTNTYVRIRRSQSTDLAIGLQLNNLLGIATGAVWNQSGATTYPALKRSSTTLQVRLADDSAFAPVQGKLTTDTAYTAGTIALTGYITLYDSTGTAYKVPCAA